MIHMGFKHTTETLYFSYHVCKKFKYLVLINSRKQVLSYISKNNLTIFIKIKNALGFPGGAVVKNPPANAGYMSSSPGLGRSHILRSN